MRGRHRHHHGVSVSHQPESPPDHIHLSQLHFPTPLPPPVIRTPPTTFLRLDQRRPNDPEMQVSHESIYRSLFVQTRGGLRKELTAHLRTKRATRRPAGHVNPMGAVFARTFSTSPNVLPKLPTGPCPDTGNLHAFVKRPEPALVAAVPGRWCGRGASPRGWCSVVGRGR